MKRAIGILIFLLRAGANAAPVKTCPRGAIQCDNATPQRILNSCYESLLMFDKENNQVCNFEADLTRLKGLLISNNHKSDVFFQLKSSHYGFTKVVHTHPTKNEEVVYVIDNIVKGSADTELYILQSGDYEIIVSACYNGYPSPDKRKCVLRPENALLL